MRHAALADGDMIHGMLVAKRGVRDMYLDIYHGMRRMCIESVCGANSRDGKSCVRTSVTE